MEEICPDINKELKAFVLQSVESMTERYIAKREVRLKNWQGVGIAVFALVYTFSSGDEECDKEFHLADAVYITDSSYTLKELKDISFQMFRDEGYTTCSPSDETKIQVRSRKPNL